jgi:hypothetical protein
MWGFEAWGESPWGSIPDEEVASVIAIDAEIIGVVPGAFALSGTVAAYAIEGIEPSAIDLPKVKAHT